MSYEYNEEKMMEAIRAYKAENKAKVVIARRDLPSATPESNNVIARAAEVFKFNPLLIASARRDRPFVSARAVVVLVLRKKFLYSMPRIGRILNRHHTSIIHLERKALKHYGQSDAFRRAANEVAGMDLSSIQAGVAIKRDALGIPKRSLEAA